MKLLQSYRLRLQRKRWRIRAFRKRRELKFRMDRSARIGKKDILLFCALSSTDGTDNYLSEQPDVSLYTSESSYKRSRFGVDWLNWLLRKHGHGHWCLSVDVDEFLVYPFCDTRPLRALTDWLGASSIKSFGTMLLDMYPKGSIDLRQYQEGQNPFEIASWFDSGNYTIRKNERFGNLWIQGGPRARAFFANNPERAPALNKVPLVKWERGFTYVSSSHMLLPRGLNLVYDEWGGEKTSGCLLHAKFLNTIVEKSEEELKRKQHFANSHEYKSYVEGLSSNPDLWCKWSEKYVNWRQLEILGLMSKGNWA